MISLVERIEAARKPYPASKEELLLALGWTEKDGVVFDPDGHRAMRILDPLSSVDDAMTLIGRSDMWRLGHDGKGADPSMYLCEIVTWTAGDSIRGLAHTPAHAMCAAALRSRGVE